MSGGSWNYVCHQVDDAAGRCLGSNIPARRAFGSLLVKVAKALHDIEWVDSCDLGPGDEVEAIKDALGQNAEVLVLAGAVANAREELARLSATIKAAEAMLKSDHCNSNAKPHTSNA